MKKIGIIAEYNPFHNGHLYQINKIKKIYNNCIIVVILSGNFTQKADASIINKWEKTKVALNNNVDLVVELPSYFALEGADMFAKGSISLLKELKIDTLVFDSELGDINILYNLAHTQINNAIFEEKIKNYLSYGFSYPNSLSKSLKDITNLELKNPIFIDNYFDLLKYKILTEKDLSIYQTVDEGIKYRIKKYINQSNSLEELINLCKTKRYTYNRIKRTLIQLH